ncbi:helix-turn-helix transcriptional regulator [Sediminibacillus albus]|uniref:AraC-type DNA-binding protein n=1 Tax=Sediminibacillus albus TaxID=407036 RepID=A0A1G8YCH8_9BACI|nr:AraC family transcriptional regulator [Sediminibacillus albus]SDK00406.1 AraC-type DNA-binding protein [Sediminibacillus albus]
MGVKHTILYDAKNTFGDKEKFLLKKLKVVLIDNFHVLENKNLERYKMLIILEGSHIANYDKSVIKEFEKRHIPLISINKVPKEEVFELVFNIINVQIDFNELTHLNNEKIIEALIYIEKNLQNSDLCLKNVSNHLFLNTAYFSRFFRGIMGIGFKDYLIKLRISKAKQMLESGHLVTDVCMAIGYTNLSYFSKVFKKEVGVSPSCYRKRYHMTDKEDNNVRKIL